MPDDEDNETRKENLSEARKSLRDLQNLSGDIFETITNLVDSANDLLYTAAQNQEIITYLIFEELGVHKKEEKKILEKMDSDDNVEDIIKYIEEVIEEYNPREDEDE